MKTCSKCRIAKSYENFHKCKSRKDGYNHRCKECQKYYENRRKTKDKELTKLNKLNKRLEKLEKAVPPPYYNTNWIPLTKGKFALINQEKFEKLINYNWFCNSSGYAERSERTSNGTKHILMHRQILDFPKDLEIDHINGDPLDNRIENLRVVEHQQNLFNSPKPKNNTSGFKGVEYLKNRQKYRARIGINKKKLHLGYFDDPIEAAKAYDKAALKLYGKYARLNFPIIF